MKTSPQLFEYKSYKNYLNELLQSLPKNGHGYRKKLAEAAQCQVAYISHVLNGNYHFSLEQIEKISTFLNHTDEQKNYLLTLVEYERAGTATLKEYFNKKIERHQTHYLRLKHRFAIQNSLSEMDQTIYYSAWYYSAIHMCLTIKGFQNHPEKISKSLQLPLTTVLQVLNFLESKKLSQKVLHLDKKSPLIDQHHAQWKLKTIQSLIQKSSQDLHYSGCITVSKKDSEKIRHMISQFLEEFSKVVKPSPEEELYCLSVDFFNLMNL